MVGFDNALAGKEAVKVVVGTDRSGAGSTNEQGARPSSRTASVVRLLLELAATHGGKLRAWKLVVWLRETQGQAGFLLNVLNACFA